MRRFAGLAVLVLVALRCSGDSGGGGDSAGGGGSPDALLRMDRTGGGGGGGGSGDVPLAADGELVVVTLGDSLTEGMGDDEYDDRGVWLGFPGRLRARLAARGADVDVVNLGRSGWTSDDLVRGVSWTDPPEPSQLSRALPLLQAAADENRRPVATVWIGSNDLTGLYGWCHAPDNEACEAEALTVYTSNLDTTLGQLRATGATVFVALLDDQTRRPAMSDPAYAGTFPDIGPADLPLMSAQVSAFNEALRTLAATHGATFVDFFETTVFEDAATVAEDGFHPNAAGYDLVTNLWEAALVTELGL